MTASLQKHPHLTALACAVLARAERSGATEVRIRLDEKTAPFLFQAQDSDSQVFAIELIGSLAKTGWVQLSLKPAREFDTFLDRKPTLVLKDIEALASWAGYPLKRDSWHSRFLRMLQDATRSSSGWRPSEELVRYFSANPFGALEGLPLEEAFSLLAKLAAIVQAGEPRPLRQLASQLFGGRSKVLDTREELLRILGANPGQFYQAPIQLLVAGPAAFSDVVFVENLLTFEMLADTISEEFRTILFAYSAGFRGAARRLTEPAGATVYVRMGSPVQGEAVQTWLRVSRSNCFFFGDLDFSGMHILGALRQTLGSVRAWHPGYSRLLDRITEGHLPESADKIGQMDPIATGCPYADEVLLPAIRATGRYVDQESICF